MKHAVRDSMLSFFSGSEDSHANYGNPSSIHWAGRKAKVALDEAREQVAQAFAIASEEEILFTGSGTESINTALKGFYFAERAKGQEVHFFTSTIEHEATKEALVFLAGLGAQVHSIPVDRASQLDLEALAAALKRAADSAGAKSLMLSLMAANNETGSLLPLREAIACAKHYDALVHLDMVQAPGRSPRGWRLAELGADLASFSAHKFGGPKGVGFLQLRRGLKLEALLHGGAQERRRRASTHNVAGIVGLGVAASLLPEQAELAAVAALRDRLEAGILRAVSEIEVVAGAGPRLVNTSNILFPGLRGDSLLMALDLAGIAVSTGSACSSGTVNPSPVLLAQGYSKEAALSGLRFSLGPSNTAAEIDYVLEQIPGIVARIREAQAERGAAGADKDLSALR